MSSGTLAGNVSQAGNSFWLMSAPAFEQPRACTFRGVLPRKVKRRENPRMRACGPFQNPDPHVCSQGPNHHSPNGLVFKLLCSLSCKKGSRPPGRIPGAVVRAAATLRKNIKTTSNSDVQRPHQPRPSPSNCHTGNCAPQSRQYRSVGP